MEKKTNFGSKYKFDASKYNFDKYKLEPLPKVSINSRKVPREEVLQQMCPGMVFVVADDCWYMRTKNTTACRDGITKLEGYQKEINNKIIGINHAQKVLSNYKNKYNTTKKLLQKIKSDIEDSAKNQINTSIDQLEQGYSNTNSSTRISKIKNDVDNNQAKIEELEDDLENAISSIQARLNEIEEIKSNNIDVRKKFLEALSTVNQQIDEINSEMAKYINYKEE